MAAQRYIVVNNIKAGGYDVVDSTDKSKVMGTYATLTEAQQRADELNQG